MMLLMTYLKIIDHEIRILTYLIFNIIYNMKKIILNLTLLLLLVSCSSENEANLNDTETMEIPESDTPNF